MPHTLWTQKFGFSVFSPQVATRASSPPMGTEWIHELRHDGLRLISVFEGGHVRCFSIQGKDLSSRVPGLIRRLSRLRIKEGVLDGELVSGVNDGYGGIEALEKEMARSQPKKLIYFVFDLPSLEGADLRRLPLIERKRILSNLLKSLRPGDSRIRLAEHVVGQGPQLLDLAGRLGLGGLISKRSDGIYGGGQSGQWLESRCPRRREFQIAGYISGPKRSGRPVRSLLLADKFKSGELLYAGMTGTGLNSPLFSRFKKELEASRVSRLKVHDPAGNLVHKPRVNWVKTRKKAEVELSGWSHGQILKGATLMGVHGGRNCRATEMAGMPLTRKERVLFSPGITKGELALYYAAVKKWILPYLKERPLAVIRCPDDHEKICFFRKHDLEWYLGPEAGRHISQVNTREYIQVGDFEGLISLVQGGVLEIHPWGSRVSDLEKPDQMIFDLDPVADVSWKQLVEGAFRLRNRLERLKLRSFVKTTGGRGLHVVVPLVPDQNWEDVRFFARLLTESLSLDDPAHFAPSATAGDRQGRIFVDYMRNGRGATSVLPYSPRAKARGPVSTPVSWDELESLLASDLFTVRNLSWRLENLKEDPWHDFFKVRQRLPEIRTLAA